jgi:hypothetical protein
MLRCQAAAQLAGAEIAQHNALFEKKKTELSSLQTQRDDAAAKAGAINAAVPQPSAATASAASGLFAGVGPADAAQKQVEEIYGLIGSNKIEDAVNRFKEQKANLTKYVSAETFKVLNSTIDQLSESLKKNNVKK